MEETRESFTSGFVQLEQRMNDRFAKPNPNAGIAESRREELTRELDLRREEVQGVNEWMGQATYRCRELLLAAT